MRIYPGTALQAQADREGQLRRGASLLAPTFYQPRALPLEEVEALIAERAAGRAHWVLGSGGESVSRIVERMHLRGHVGPLWEKLVR